LVMLILWHLLCEGDRKMGTRDINHTKSVTKEGHNQQFYHQNAIHNQEKRDLLFCAIPPLITN
jgi:hypothetical protein